MIRYSFFILTVLGTAATAIAAIVPGHDPITINPNNVTIIEKNQFFPIYGEIIVEPCAVEDCSDVTS